MLTRIVSAFLSVAVIAAAWQVQGISAVPKVHTLANWTPALAEFAKIGVLGVLFWALQRSPQQKPQKPTTPPQGQQKQNQDKK
jgi:cyanate permease